MINYMLKMNDMIWPDPDRIEMLLFSPVRYKHFSLFSSSTVITLLHLSAPPEYLLTNCCVPGCLSSARHHQMILRPAAVTGSSLVADHRDGLARRAVSVRSFSCGATAIIHTI